MFYKLDKQLKVTMTKKIYIVKGKYVRVDKQTKEGSLKNNKRLRRIKIMSQKQENKYNYFDNLYK